MSPAARRSVAVDAVAHQADRAWRGVRLAAAPGRPAGAGAARLRGDRGPEGRHVVALRPARGPSVGRARDPQGGALLRPGAGTPRRATEPGSLAGRCSTASRPAPGGASPARPRPSTSAIRRCPDGSATVVPDARLIAVLRDPVGPGDLRLPPRSPDRATRPGRSRSRSIRPRPRTCPRPPMPPGTTRPAARSASTATSPAVATPSSSSAGWRRSRASSSSSSTATRCEVVGSPTRCSRSSSCPATRHGRRRRPQRRCVRDPGVGSRGDAAGVLPPARRTPRRHSSGSSCPWAT